MSLDKSSDVFIRAKNGDIDAYEIILKEYERLIYSIAFRMLSNKEDACDITQEVCLKIYLNISKCPNLSNIKNWICTITKNTCVDFIRKNKNRQTDSINSTEKMDYAETIPSKEPTPEKAYIQKESKQLYEKILSEMSHEHRQYLILRDIEGFSYQDISDICQIPIGTVKSKISRARTSICEKIKKQKELIY